LRRLTRARFAATLVALLATALAAAALSLATGPSDVGAGQVLRALCGGAVDPATADIVLRVRLPRVALALAVGAALAVAGAIFQALLRNPLADPFVLGVSGGAALGGVAVLTLGAGLGLGYGAVPPAAFAGAVLTTLLLYVLAGAQGRTSATTLLLTGVVFNAFASAAIVFLASLAGLAEGASIFLWLIGSLGAARVEVAGSVAAFLVLGLAVALPLARHLDLLTLGSEAAAQLGVRVERDMPVLLVATSLLVGAAVSAAGLIGFVGLIVPHALRSVLGPDHRLLVPAAALAGAAFLVLCDTVARTLLAGGELPVGAITAVLGGPLFLWLLRRRQSTAFAL
jgi:iron complex transport system permease protein